MQIDPPEVEWISLRAVRFKLIHRHPAEKKMPQRHKGKF
ncbi:hypothetical protein D1BOALGB6SA_479 [Olavius sp. associated proteobacterium Delta 1]|nr:hypothetical protein D1BOALGB6SA_479 [Olavius sp. associated proteobacterium Delta 1]